MLVDQEGTPTKELLSKFNTKDDRQSYRKKKESIEATVRAMNTGWLKEQKSGFGFDN